MTALHICTIIFENLLPLAATLSGRLDVTGFQKIGNRFFLSSNLKPLQTLCTCTNSQLDDYISSLPCTHL